MFCDIVVPTGAELVVKRGETMLLAILRDRMARPLTKHHTWLTKTLRDRIDIDGIEVVNTHDSVTIQSADVNKAKGFLRLLDELGINRNSIFMISMGDGENDVPMFHEADMSIAFGDNRKVTPYADLNMGADSLSASRALNVIREHARRVGSVYLGKPEIIRELDTQVA
jgi:trehalose-6-phosphatase